jgi:hypothetical protein
MRFIPGKTSRPHGHPETMGPGTPALYGAAAQKERKVQIGSGIYSISQEEGGHVHAYLLDGGDGLPRRRFSAHAEDRP